MFERLFANSGLSLDRLRALVEVGAAGSIVGASRGDSVRQSQLSRQIKELEEFFQVRLSQRQGKNLRLTPNGKELARISRFFLLGLSNFHRGSLAGEQHFRIGATATFIEAVLLPALARPERGNPEVRHEVEVILDEDIERRLHELTLDFGVVTAPALSRPLQVRELGAWRLVLWVPRMLRAAPPRGWPAILEAKLPVVLAERELSSTVVGLWPGIRPAIVCESFLQARTLLETGRFVTLLPDFLGPRGTGADYHRIALEELDGVEARYRLAWNPRLLRLNPQASRHRDRLADLLAARLRDLGTEVAAGGEGALEDPSKSKMRGVGTKRDRHSRKRD